MEHEAQVGPVDVTVAVSDAALGAAVVITRRAVSVLDPVARALLRPRLLPEQLHAGRWLAATRRQGQARRVALREELSRRLDVLVPDLLTEVLPRADLTELLLRYVDLDRVVAGVDLDGAVRRVDLTAVVLERVDLDAVIRAILDRLDLVGLAAEVIEGVDLPEIIRESTGTMASDTVQGARLRAIDADEAVSRAVDRFLLRRQGRSTRAPAASVVTFGGQPASVAPRDRPG